MRHKLMFGSAFVVLMLVCWAWPAVAQEATGASATKDCPVETVSLGQVVTCTFVFENIGVFPAVVTTMTETRPSGTVTVSCIPLNAPSPVTVGDTLNPDDPCTVAFDFTIPNDPALCGTFIEDSAEFEIHYEDLDLTAGAFATHVVQVACAPPTTTTTALPTTTTAPFVPVTSPPPSTPTPTPTPNTLPMTGSSTGPMFFAIALLVAGILMVSSGGMMDHDDLSKNIVHRQRAGIVIAIGSGLVTLGAILVRYGVNQFNRTNRWLS